MSSPPNLRSGREILAPLDMRGATPFSRTIAQAARSAMASLAVHKLRAALTMVGIVVGVAGVLIVLTLAIFARATNAHGFGKLGANVIDVQGFRVASVAPAAGNSHGVVAMASGAPSLTAADVQALRKLPHVVAVSPTDGTGSEVQAGSHNWSGQILAAYPDIQITQGYSVQHGAFFSQADVSGANTVAVLGQTVAKQLFPGGKPVGQQVRIGSVDFSVVGVLKPVGGGGNADAVVFVPISTFLQRLMGAGKGMRISKGGGPTTGVSGPPPSPPPDVERITLQGATGNPALLRTNFPDVQVAVDDVKNVDAVKAAITTTLRRDHGITSPAPDDFTVGGFLQGVKAAQQGDTTITWVMGAIAGVALLIGGFGVANVMLAAVAERRREIGVRLAVGAAVQDIFWQFLLEALTVSLLGGLIGVVFGVALAFVLPLLYGGKAVHPPLSWVTIVTSLAAAIVIGLAFGAYPARRAARTDPIAALRAQ